MFNTLERQFQKTLPTAIHAFTQAIELIGRTLAYLAPQTGHFIGSLDRLFTRLNGSGWDKWTHDLNTVVGLFRTWETFLKLVFEDLAKIFGLTASLGSGIIQELTGYLETLHKALSTTSKQKSDLGALFRGHKQEILELIKLIVQLGTSYGKFYIQAAPAFIFLTVQVLKLANALILLISKIPGGSSFLAFTLGIGIMLKKLGLLGTFLGTSTKEVGLLGKALGLLGKATGVQALIRWIGTGLSTAAGASEKAITGLFSLASGGLDSAARGTKLAIQDLLGIGREGGESSGIAGFFGNITSGAAKAASKAKQSIASIFEKTSRDEGGFYHLPVPRG